MSAKTSILLTGATGYIGGSILTRFLQRPDASSLDIRLLVRSAEKAKKIQDLDLGVTVIIGSHSDSELMEELASQVDVVLATADCDDINAAQSALRGLKKRYEATGKAPIFIETSGTGVYADMVNGAHANSEVFDDANADQIETLSPTAPHRPVDEVIVSGDAEGYVRSYIVLPSTVWGIAKGPLFESKISNPHSKQIPYCVRAGLVRGQGGMLTEGRNVWPLVEIHELSDLYSMLYDAIQSGNPMVRHGREGYFNAVYDEYSMQQLARGISEALVILGRGKTTEPSSFTQEELVKFFGPFGPFFGSNCRCLATNSKAIGWAPKKGLKEMLASIRYEAEALIAAEGL
ncbi:NAD-binding protein [Rhodocollybia butyracea]|uniref:NAD-binding protein n=1 Tax=Rhodocollybia butyracea TaxID=206335 RepID=A0A9P5QB73_9AGAR|nr:NAD-binding protein [Rhodocollybia butyracea]